jgi:hypothetical protein
MPDHQAFGEGSVVMRAGRADGEELIAVAGNEHRIVADMAADHPTVGNIFGGNALREIGARGLRLLGAHQRILLP